MRELENMIANYDIHPDKYDMACLSTLYNIFYYFCGLRLHWAEDNSEIENFEEILEKYERLEAGQVFKITIENNNIVLVYGPNDPEWIGLPVIA